MLRLTGRKHLHLIYEHLWDGFKLEKKTCAQTGKSRWKSGLLGMLWTSKEPENKPPYRDPYTSRRTDRGMVGALDGGGEQVCLFDWPKWQESDRSLTARCHISPLRAETFQQHSFIHFTLARRLSDVMERERERRSVRQPDRPQRLRDNYCLYRVLSVFSDRGKEKWQGWKGEPAGGTLRYILLKEQLIVQVRPVQTTAGHARKGWFLRAFFPNDIWNFKRNALIISIPHIGMSWPTFISNIWTFFFML